MKTSTSDRTPLTQNARGVNEPASPHERVTEKKKARSIDRAFFSVLCWWLEQARLTPAELRSSRVYRRNRTYGSCLQQPTRIYNRSRITSISRELSATHGPPARSLAKPPRANARRRAPSPGNASPGTTFSQPLSRPSDATMIRLGGRKDQLGRRILRPCKPLATRTCSEFDRYNRCMRDARQTLEQYFLEMRWRCLSLAADLDRIERSPGGRALLDSDPRLKQLRAAISVLLDGSGNRAEQVQDVFSDKSAKPQ